MKLINVFFIVFVSLILLFSNHPTLGQEAQKNVEDYFFLLPSEHWDLNGQVYNKQEKATMIDEKDFKNGWIKFSGKDAKSAWEGWGEFVIFRKPDKSALIAVTIMSCGPQCEQSLKFFDFVDNKWKDISASVFKPLTTEQISLKYKKLAGNDEYANEPPVLYVLPRYGTTIKVITQKDICGKSLELFTYTYLNGKFNLKEE